jgi:hypothetical protein
MQMKHQRPAVKRGAQHFYDAAVRGIPASLNAKNESARERSRAAQLDASLSVSICE